MVSTVGAVVDHNKGVTEVIDGGSSRAPLSYVVGSATPAAVEIVRGPIEARVMHSSWEWAWSIWIHINRLTKGSTGEA